jgi:Bax protein
MVRAVNSRIRDQRVRLIDLYRIFTGEGTLGEEDLRRLRDLCERYRVEWRSPPDREMFSSLLLRVDTVPLELALAQAANESGWGTSRFARKGNNIFGEWCFKPGCGLVPRERYPGKVHEVAVFSSPIDSLRSYMNKLNSHPAYRPFRILRYEMRLRGRRPDGYTLAKGLTKYSSLRQEYVERIQGMIRTNMDLMIPAVREAKKG